MEAILLLGHGSRLTEANSALKHMADLVKKTGDIPLVEIAFLQFSKPDFFDGVSACAAKGAKKIIILPYFLYKGRHFEEDIGELIIEAQKRYKDVEFFLTEPLGVHENIAKVIIERVTKDIKPFKVLNPHEIEEKSLEIITKTIGETNFTPLELPVVKRVIHATGDFDFTKNMRFHPDAVEAGIRAIKNGKDILVDVSMVEAGINKTLLQKWGGKVICNIQGAEHKTQNTDNPPLSPLNLRGDERGVIETHKTRAEIGIEIGLKENNNIGMVAIGNAPTALYRVMKLIRNTDFKPELVIGVPVGFVKAVESKEVLLHMKYPFITSLGRKGGSPVAVAIVNALLKIAEGK
ncbi:MAG: precorrin-8X methylmutase [Nitrospirae bacterium]|nr:precorrin-8X methylmutase [Nitrospirota bacterium]